MPIFDKVKKLWDYQNKYSKQPLPGGTLQEVTIYGNGIPDNRPRLYNIIDTTLENQDSNIRLPYFNTYEYVDSGPFQGLTPVLSKGDAYKGVERWVDGTPETDKKYNRYNVINYNYHDKNTFFPAYDNKIYVGRTDPNRNQYIKGNKSMIKRKFQQGGQMDQQQQALVQFIQGIAQVAQVDPQQVMQLAQQEPDRLETAVQVFQQTQDIQQAAQAFFQKEVQSAKKGAKLNYLKELSGKCPEGQQLVYFKSGGHICSKCMAKKQKGDTIEEAKCGSKMKKKKGCGGFKINKAKFGGSLNGIPFKQPGGIVKRINNTLYGLKKWADITNHPQSAQGTVTTKNGIDRTIWENEFGQPTDTTYTHPIYPEWYAKKIYEEGGDNLINRGIRKVKKIIANPKFSLGDGGSLN